MQMGARHTHTTLTVTHTATGNAALSLLFPFLFPPPVDLWFIVNPFASMFAQIVPPAQFSARTNGLKPEKVDNTIQHYFAVVGLSVWSEPKKWKANQRVVALAENPGSKFSSKSSSSHPFPFLWKGCHPLPLISSLAPPSSYDFTGKNIREECECVNSTSTSIIS